MKKIILILSISLLLCAIFFIINKPKEETITQSTDNIKILVNGIETDEFPSSTDGYAYDGISCKNGTTATWDETNWKLNIQVKKEDKCIVYFVEKEEYLFSYTGATQTFIVPETGYYKLEAWGAQAPGTTNGASVSKGAYTSGTIYLTENEKIYIYVGEGLKRVSNVTSFNGGTGNSGGYPGGGSTDFRLISGSWNNINSLKSRIMVAAGSGGGANTNATHGAGGALLGLAALGTSGGTQLTFGAVQSASYTASTFGVANGGCSGGNGYYPGGGATCINGAGGGSSFISGYAGVNAVLQTGGTTSNPTPSYTTKHYSNKYFINGVMIAGNAQMPSHTGTSTMIGNSGHGYAKITKLTKPEKTNSNLNSVRYIKDCTNGSTSNAGNYWVEIQAIKDGVNIAKGKTVTGSLSTGTLAITNSQYIVDGDITHNRYGSAAGIGIRCVTVDLGSTYDLDEVVVWHFYNDSRTTYNNTLSVGATNKTNLTSLDKILINNKSTLSSSQGQRFSAY